jgi:hypothetical protein
VRQVGAVENGLRRISLGEAIIVADALGIELPGLVAS